ncbi:helix-loop-helix protein delilah [Drosophila montana]|uniref:helix-loop-helix protein delilah n=1 Tax=Drosophila montana TaxID=40370 RepID=UPI00313AF78D
MKSSTCELHNYADLDMEPDSVQPKADSRKRKASTAAGSRRGEKYSLRQKRQKRLPGDLPETTPAPVAELQPTATPAAKAKAKSSAKTKAPPLSKYRRKTANARERTRMREINTAFEQLRHCVPQSITGEDAANTNEKLTKITTLRLAMKYIGMLSESLQDPSYESEFLVECLRESANREAHVSLDTEPELDLELELEPTPPVKSKKPAKTSKKTPARRQSKQSKAATAAATPTMATTTSAPSSSPESCYASSSVGSPAFCVAACSPSSAYASLSSAASSSCSSSGSVHGSATLDADSLLGMQALSELNTLLLESDSDSLHCLNSSYHPDLLTSAGSVLPSRGDLPISMNLPLDKPDVELSLRLLDHSTDSFDFASDQQPSACISPLATLDSFHPFADLLHGEFPDIFLT